MAEHATLRSSVIHLLHRAGQRADDLFTRAVAGLDVTPRQFVVLLAVSEAEGLSQTDIMDATGIDRSSTADLVRRLIKKRFLRRRRAGSDTRSYEVRLTPEGQQILTRARPAVLAVEQRLLALVSSQDRARALSILKQLVAAPDATG